MMGALLILSLSDSRMRFPLTVIVLAFLVVGCAAGCTDDTGGGEDRVAVVATTSQIGALTRQVAGDRVALTVLLGAGEEAHSFDADVGQARKIHDADLILRNGIGLDDFLDGMIEGTDEASVVTVTDGVKVEKGAEDAGEDDPHVWHDVDNAKQMTLRIAEALAEVDPENASAYDRAARDYMVTLDEADREIRTLIDAIPASQRKMVTNHDAFGYFIRRYDLEYVGAVFPSSGAESQPSAGDIARLEDLIEEEGVRAIFAEEELDAKVARQISNDTGVKIVDDLYADSLGKPGSGADSIHGMLLSNARKIAEALR